VKRKDLAIDTVLGARARSPWGEIEMRVVEGAPSVNEVVFFHRPSATLLVTDLVFNIVRPATWQTRMLLRLTGTCGHLAQSRAWRFLFTKDPARAAESAAAILDWPFERLAPAHGDVVTGDAHAALARALRPMLRGARSVPALTAGADRG
jgi:hypothetical protein